MIPQKGQHVQCLLRVGGMVEGIVEIWSDDKTVLRSLDNKSLMIISKTADDIVLVKVMLPERELPEIRSAIQEKLKEVQHPTGEPEIDATNLKQLRRMVVEQDRKIIADKIKEHHLVDVKSKVPKYESKYGYPGIHSIKSTK